MDQLLSNINSAKIDLRPDELGQLNDVFVTAIRYPYWMIERQGVNRIPEPGGH